MNRHNCMEAFERQYSDERLAREDPRLWLEGAIYQDGMVNRLYTAFERGCTAKESADPWQQVMAIAEGAGFIVSAAGGTAVLATHEAQRAVGIYVKTQKMNGRETDEQ